MTFWGPIRPTAAFQATTAAAAPRIVMYTSWGAIAQTAPAEGSGSSPVPVATAVAAAIGSQPRPAVSAV